MKRTKLKDKEYMLKGGPLNGKIITLSTPGTVVFRLHGQKGRYNEENVWVPHEGGLYQKSAVSQSEDR